jgi:molecular chaperone GrpE (heat shock protein)
LKECLPQKDALNRVAEDKNPERKRKKKKELPTFSETDADIMRCLLDILKNFDAATKMVSI